MTLYSFYPSSNNFKALPIFAEANLIAYHGLGKYVVYRHENNNSAWTQNHALINEEILGEYLRVYRKRTEWLSGLYPNNSLAWRYFEWSFMISMVEKVTRLGLSDCYQICDKLQKKLCENRETFINCGYILDFEREWMNEYVK